MAFPKSVNFDFLLREMQKKKISEQDLILLDNTICNIFKQTNYTPYKRMAHFKLAI